MKEYLLRLKRLKIILIFVFLLASICDLLARISDEIVSIGVLAVSGRAYQLRPIITMKVLTNFFEC